MVLASFGTLLVPAIGGAPLLRSGFGTTGLAAIAMPAIAVRADEEETMAILSLAKPLTERLLRACS
jgi:hypothetical protein